MDKLKQYRQCIQNLLSEYAAIPIANGEIESETIYDLQQDRYLVMNVGWDGNRYVHGCVLHLDIKDGKIWVQQNTTELRIAHELVAMGIPKEDIILGFQAPYLRQYTDFGVA
ncbi:fatty-acid oxidation protein subunit alpha [Nostoc sp. ATCC 43529]|nr:fatty-acid oxidation protein subunit alpha [Nostoc sp. ATCC 43529]